MLSVFWFRRDLRLEDNQALYQALQGPYPVLPVFMFDEHILEELPADDARVNFIYQQLEKLQAQLLKKNSALLVLKGSPLQLWQQLLAQYQVKNVYLNRDYEPYARRRDEQVTAFLKAAGAEVISCKDGVIFEEQEIVKADGKPYTMFTPYKRKWLEHYRPQQPLLLPLAAWQKLLQHSSPFPSLQQLGFTPSAIQVRPYSLAQLPEYATVRNLPARDATSYLSPHLRFGTVSVRQVLAQLGPADETFLSELVWREFFMQILWHFPQVVNGNFKSRYNGIRWRNQEEEFARWCQGTTGYPLVDAGMRQLNETGYMHNRVRMVTASFLCKHLLIDWRWGEAYFAKKLLDFELASNNGNWQWAAGTGCDAAPYFRVFNPAEQLKKFDKEGAYVKRWVPEWGSRAYPAPMVVHKFARDRALKTYKEGLAAPMPDNS